MSILDELARSIEWTGNIRDDTDRFLRRHHCPNTAEHGLKVGEEARRVALRFQVDPVQAEAAGYLHDVSAIFPNQERIRVARQLGIDVLPEEEKFPMIVHQKISAVMAKELFGVEDESVLSAIGCHTTLKANSTPLDRVLFVADKIEWDQQGRPPYLRELLKQLDVSLEHAAFEYIRFLWRQKQSLKVVHPYLADAYFELKERLGESD